MTTRLIKVGIASAVAAVGAALFVSPFAATGCGTQCDRNPNEPPVVWDAGVTTSPGQPYASYESAGWSGPYLDFPPGRTYRFNHALGDCPKKILTYGSFNGSPVVTPNMSRARGGSALIVGNQATIELVTPTTFDVRNDTCSDVFLRVEADDPGSSGCTKMPDAVAATTPPVTDAGSGDAAPP